MTPLKIEEAVTRAKQTLHAIKNHTTLPISSYGMQLLSDAVIHLDTELKNLGNEYSIVCHFKEQLAKLQIENLQMREALEKIYNTECSHCLFSDYSVLAYRTLRHLPLTQKLADRIKMLEETVRKLCVYKVKYPMFNSIEDDELCESLDALEKNETPPTT